MYRSEPLKPGYMRVARLLRLLLITVKLTIYKNIFKAQLVVHYYDYKNSGTSHLYHGFLLYISLVPRRPPTGKASGDVAQDARSSFKSTS